MSQKIPYQPFLFRVLHSINGFVAFGALLTGFFVYDSYDRRFGYLGLTTQNRSLIDIHGAFGFFLFFIILPLFLAYSVIKGKKRLITKPNQIKNLSQQSIILHINLKIAPVFGGRILKLFGIIFGLK